MIEEKLDKALREIWDDDNFVFCTMKTLPTDENKEELLLAIQNGWAKGPTEVMLYSLAIYYDDDYDDYGIADESQ